MGMEISPPSSVFFLLDSELWQKKFCCTVVHCIMIGFTDRVLNVTILYYYVKQPFLLFGCFPCWSSVRI